MDIGGQTAIRSPWALQAWHHSDYDGFSTTPSHDTPSTFPRCMGTAQGDVSSPHTWTAFFDILLTALDITSAQDDSCNFRAPGAHRLL